MPKRSRENEDPQPGQVVPSWRRPRPSSPTNLKFESARDDKVQIFKLEQNQTPKLVAFSDFFGAEALKIKYKNQAKNNNKKEPKLEKTSPKTAVTTTSKQVKSMTQGRSYPWTEKILDKSTTLERSGINGKLEILSVIITLIDHPKFQ
jgi:hypothetical protein